MMYYLLFHIFFSRREIMQNTISGNQIRELELRETELVGGGAIELGTGAKGLFSARNVAGALRLAGGLGLLYQAGKLGWDLGSWGYNSYTRYKYSSR
jgi:hypothetical protein